VQTRKPIVSGQFYPGDRNACIDEMNRCLEEYTLPESLPETIVAGIVPHAGWVFSGSAAAAVFAAIKHRHERVDSFVVFGAAHAYFGRTPAIYAAGAWLTPLGEVPIDEELARQLLDKGVAQTDSAAHTSEHSIEVQVPFIQYLFRDAKILPIVVPPTDDAIQLGTDTGEIIGCSENRIICVGSTDLTHYGPRYGFTPMGVGAEAIEWATRINDKKFIELALALKPDGMLVDAAENSNACGPGAAAATVAAAARLGKTRGTLLVHTNSNEVMKRKMGTTSSESVGYAAMVF